ncbi:Enoyl-[acyl-carrier-protein] reductase [NADH], chloroplastic [Morella rubra]|uniref:Enoyl-[acyl-carrier-protein] reductase [NADH], chloroplastic n=1 Tax=Morella rubra TaxID=262757 RepID=A0A6A1WRI4_9ROSI|nr:Enoyl-[acyl-carrier-protein] reductase [NADH], chloroplastic [Morella rubra]
MAITGRTSGLLLAAASRRSISSYPTSLFKRSVRSFSDDAQPEAIENKSAASDLAIENKPAASGLAIDLKGKRAFVAGVADTKGYGWAISKALAAAGAEILVGTWLPVFPDFECKLKCKGSEALQLPGGSRMKIPKLYPLEAAIDNPEDVAYNEEVAQSVEHDYKSIDIIVHSIEQCPEVVAVIGGSAIALSFIASQRIIPGYGGGMSSAKAALESDTRVLAYEAGRRKGIRVNTISAGPQRSLGAKSIEFTEKMIEYSKTNAPLQKELHAEEVGNTAAFLASPLASAITGAVIHVDNGLNAMGVGDCCGTFEDLYVWKN